MIDGVSAVGIGSSLILYGLLTDPGEKNTQLPMSYQRFYHQCRADARDRLKE